MKNYNIYEIELNGKFRKVGPECGFGQEGAARAFAYARASDRWLNRKQYLIVNGDLVAVYPGEGLRLVNDAVDVLSIHDHDDDDQALAEAA
jgi:hypothetical protein